MHSLIPTHNPPRPHCALARPCSIQCILLTHPCTTSESLTRVPPTDNAKQFAIIRYKCYKAKIALPAAKIPSSFEFRHSFVIGH